MKILYDENGLLVKSLFKTRRITYSELRSVVLSNSEFTFITKTDEVLNSKKHFYTDYAVLYNAIKKYNINFKDEEEFNGLKNVYSISEVYDKTAQMQIIVEEYAGNKIRNKYGAEYGIDCKITDEGEYINMLLRLNRNGELVKMPKEINLADIEPYAFDDIVVAFLVEWDENGRYGITSEVENREACEEYLDDALNSLFDGYRG